MRNNNNYSTYQSISEGTKKEEDVDDSSDFAESESMPLTRLRPRRRDQARPSSPKTTPTTTMLRKVFFVAIVLAVFTTMVCYDRIIYSEEDYDDDDSVSSLSSAWKMGWHGMKAQSLADASIIRQVGVTDPNSVLELLGSSKQKHKKQVVVVVDDSDSVMQNATSTAPAPADLKPEEGCETTVMLIRHCEKGNLKSHCNFNGYERAVYLATQFGDTGKERWPAPSKLYALKAKGRGRKHGNVNHREVETVQFLADKVGIPINEDYQTNDNKKLAHEILTSIVGGQQCGKLTVVSWKHSDLPKLAQHLGCGPLEGCPLDFKGREFDQVWQLKFVYRTFHPNDRSKVTLKRHISDITKTKRRNHQHAKKHWDVFGSVQYEQFDPLAYSKQVGDYPHGGTPTGARWVTANLRLYD